MRLPERCIDLTPAHVIQALRSSVAMGALLSHMARVAKPITGAAKILVPIGRIASNECSWVQQGLRVEISGTTEVTYIDIFVQAGRSARELLYPRLELAVNRAELLKALKMAPQVVSPLSVKLVENGAVMTCAVSQIGSLPAPAFEVAEAAIRRSLPPTFRNSLPPIKPALSSIDVGNAGGELALLKLISANRDRVPAPKIELEPLSDFDAAWDEVPGPPSTPPKGKSMRPSKAPARAKSVRPSKAPKAPAPVPRPAAKQAVAPPRPSKRPAAPPAPRPR